VTPGPRKVRLAVQSADAGNPPPFAVDLAAAAKQLPKDQSFVLDLVTVAVTTRPGSTPTQAGELFAANVDGVDADLIATDHTALRALAARGVLQDLGPILEKQSWFKKEDYINNVLQTGQIQGVQVGLPLDASIDVVGYNKTRFQHQGVAEPATGWTWDELVVAARALTTTEQWGIEVTAWSPSVLSLAWQYGAEIVSAPGKISVTEPGTIQALTFLDRLLRVEKVGPPLDKQKPLAQDNDPFATHWTELEASNSPDVGRLNQGTIAMLATLSTRAPGGPAWWRRESFLGFAEDVSPFPTGARAGAFGAPFAIVGIPTKSANRDQSIAALRDLIDLADQSEALSARKTSTRPRQRVASLTDHDSTVLATTIPTARFLPGDVTYDVYQHLAADLVLPVLTGKKKPQDAAADAQKVIDAAMAG
jgi:ABC-type glycerol-3-phosphate transport system substrate-binding protein